MFYEEGPPPLVGDAQPWQAQNLNELFGNLGGYNEHIALAMALEASMEAIQESIETMDESMEMMQDMKSEGGEETAKDMDPNKMEGDGPMAGRKVDSHEIGTSPKRTASRSLDGERRIKREKL